MNEQLATIAALPWGWCTGLLCASLTVLLGVARGLEPDVILVRAATAGTIAGVTLALTKSLCLWLLVLTDNGQRR